MSRSLAEELLALPLEEALDILNGEGCRVEVVFTPPLLHSPAAGKGKVLRCRLDGAEAVVVACLAGGKEVLLNDPPHN